MFDLRRITILGFSLFGFLVPFGPAFGFLA